MDQEVTNLAELSEYRYVLRRSSDNWIAADAVEPANRNYKADSLLLFRTEGEATAFAKAMGAFDFGFTVHRLTMKEWVKMCRGGQANGYKYLSLSKVEGGRVRKRSFHLAKVVEDLDDALRDPNIAYHISDDGQHRTGELFRKLMENGE